MPKSLGYTDIAKALGVSRQRVWSLMQQRKGLCLHCPERATYRGLCDVHATQARDRQWTRSGSGNPARRNGPSGRQKRSKQPIIMKANRG